MYILQTCDDVLYIEQTRHTNRLHPPPLKSSFSLPLSLTLPLPPLLLPPPHCCAIQDEPSPGPYDHSPINSDGDAAEAAADEAEGGFVGRQRQRSGRGGGLDQTDVMARRGGGVVLSVSGGAVSLLTQFR